MRNYALEALLMEAAEKAGALPSAIQDFALDVQDFRITSASEIPAWIEACKKDKSHRFAIAGTENNELFIRAFAHGNLSAQGVVVKTLGEDRAREVAAQFGTTLGGKPGTIPESLKANIPDFDHTKPSTNPWSAHPSNLDAQGRYSARAITSQASVVKALGAEKASAIARAAGAKLGDIRPPGKRRAA